MDARYLFLRTMEDIKSAIDGVDDYEVLRSSALLRQLIIDGNRLVDIVNREHKIKLGFKISDAWDLPYTKLVFEDEPVFYAVLDGLSPDGAATKAPIKILGRDQFLAHRVVFAKGHYYTIYDIIDNCAHVMGGVHLGAPKSDAQKVLEETKNITVGGAPVSLRQLVPILKIVHKALLPLVNVVKE